MTAAHTRLLLSVGVAVSKVWPSVHGVTAAQTRSLVSVGAAVSYVTPRLHLEMELQTPGGTRRSWNSPASQVSVHTRSLVAVGAIVSTKSPVQAGVSAGQTRSVVSVGAAAWYVALGHASVTLRHLKSTGNHRALHRVTRRQHTCAADARTHLD